MQKMFTKPKKEEGGGTRERGDGSVGGGVP